MWLQQMSWDTGIGVCVCSCKWCVPQRCWTFLLFVVLLREKTSLKRAVCHPFIDLRWGRLSAGVHCWLFDWWDHPAWIHQSSNLSVVGLSPWPYFKFENHKPHFVYKRITCEMVESCLTAPVKLGPRPSEPEFWGEKSGIPHSCQCLEEQMWVVPQNMLARWETDDWK